MGVPTAAQKSAHFHRPHLAGVALTMKENVALYPLPVGGFGPDGIMLEAHDFSQLVQQFELGIGKEALRRSVRLCFSNIKPHSHHKRLLTSGLQVITLMQ